MGSRSALPEHPPSTPLSGSRPKKTGNKGLVGRSVGAAKAKAEFLALADEVNTSDISITITKRGVPFVRVAPLLEPAPEKSILGCMKGTATIVGDVVSPEPDVWEALS